MNDPFGPPSSLVSSIMEAEDERILEEVRLIIQETKMERKLTDEERGLIATTKNRAILVAAQAEKAIADAKVAELEYRNLVQQIFIKYGLSSKDTIDERTGIITIATTTETETA